MKIVKRLLIGIVTVLLTLMFVFNIYNFISIKILHKDIADFGGFAILEVVSGSMEPNIHIGDLIIIDTKANLYQKDDIVTFYDENGSFVTHRIVSINENEMITKGDNNNTEDEATDVSKIVGRYVTKISNAGKILASFKNPLVLLLILVIGLLFCFLISTDKDGKPILTEKEKLMQEFREYKKMKKKNKKKKEKTEVILNKNEVVQENKPKTYSKNYRNNRNKKYYQNNYRNNYTRSRNNNQNRSYSNNNANSRNYNKNRNHNQNYSNKNISNKNYSNNSYSDNYNSQNNNQKRNGNNRTKNYSNKNYGSYNYRNRNKKYNKQNSSYKKKEGN